MKKSNFMALILGTISGVFFALGMCMALLPEWGMRTQGIVSGVFGLILMLLSYPKKTFTRAQLMDEFWGIDSDTSLRAVDVYVTKLRDKFSGCDGFEIKTVRGLGYKAVLK